MPGLWLKPELQRKSVWHDEACEKAGPLCSHSGHSDLRPLHGVRNTMADKVWIYHENKAMGPGVVARNLMNGLREIGVEAVLRPGEADYVGCLQNPGQFHDMLPEDTLMGPNLFVLPVEAPHLCQKFKNFVVPSRWVKDLYARFPLMRDKHIDVWPVGVDTEAWSPGGDTTAEPEFDFFVYQKNIPGPIAEEVNVELKEKHGLKSGGWLTYGRYQEQGLLDLCRKCKFAVLATNTESQGLAYMQILSTGTPCFVINKKLWAYEGNAVETAVASSVPFFDQRCGMTVPGNGMLGMRDADKAQLELFVKNVDKGLYAPRDYIVENHMLVHGAEAYMNFLKKAKKQY